MKKQLQENLIIKNSHFEQYSEKEKLEKLAFFKCALDHIYEKYLIVSDLDGTLLNNQAQITNFTKEIIQLLNQYDHKFCLATGRPWRSSHVFYEQLKLDTLIANLNGAIMFQPYDLHMTPIKFVFSSHILKKLCDQEEIVSAIENIIVEDGQNLRTYRPLNEENIAALSQWFHMDLKKDKPLLGFDQLFEQKRNIPSILIQLSVNVDIDYVITLIKSKIKTLTCQMWSLNDRSHILEVNTTFANKGNSLNFFSSYYGIPWDQTIAFGDGYNDVSLLSSAHYGYAMKNSKTTTKFVAKGVTKFDNDNNGVAWKIIDFFTNILKEKHPNHYERIKKACASNSLK
ncbi:Cof-type HAD-IIB family hydrolase [[Mycoplasma] cavipharyngis]|uniref:Cof-type HAD-IIB family hydrolase n=1 Tax=[Mycoplasma] cavipharyngis TaxID=92757 RepID=UPI003703B5AB